MTRFDFARRANLPQLIPPPNQRHKSRRPAPLKEGRFAIVTNVGCGMRWTLLVRQTSVSKADGEVAWFWHPGADAKLATMLCIALATVTIKPVTGEIAKETVKTIRAGNAGSFGEPVVTCSCAFYFLHARLRVRRAPRHSLRPLSLEGRRFQNSGAICAARRRRCIVLRRSYPSPA